MLAALVAMLLPGGPQWLAAGPATAQVVAASHSIQDPAESDAFTHAMSKANPAEHAAAMEAFAAAYPNSPARVEALAQAMAAYQRLGDQGKVAGTAQRIIEAQPGNLRALAILTAIERDHVNHGDASALAAMREHAAKGSAELAAWAKPTDMPDDAYKALHDTMAVVFDGARGMALLQAKDFDGARRAYLKALAIDPDNMENAYQIGVDEMQMKPVRVSGFWWLARAVDLAGAAHNDAVQQALSTYAQGKYDAFHGSDDGWNEIVLDAADKSMPPDDFEVSPAAK